MTRVASSGLGISLVLWMVLFSTGVHSFSIDISAFNESVTVGNAVTFNVSGDTGSSLLFPFVNGKQWGAPVLAGQQLQIPFAPSAVGIARVFVAYLPTPLTAPFYVGQAVPSDAVISNEVSIAVADVQWPKAQPDVNHLVGMEWEPWFTAHNMGFQTAEAIPLVGQYDSFNVDVIQLHALWMVTAGVDFLLVDWTNNLWGVQTWDQRGVYAQELINATTAMVEVYAEMLQRGLTVPKVVLILGLDNGPQSGPVALNEEIVWAQQNYVDVHPQELFVMYDGKPLITIFDGGGIHKTVSPAIVADAFTMRWMASQLQSAEWMAQQGYWSWMDGSLAPVPTFDPTDKWCEALTITPAFFAGGGWLNTAAAHAREGGITFIEELKTALHYSPRYLIINQWNEFAGQPTPSPTYVDSYNASLSNDIEPTSLTACAYQRPGDRGCGGWGYYYLNLHRAMIDMYHANMVAPLSQTIVTVARPWHGQQVTDSLFVQWDWVGAQPSGISILVDGQIHSTVSVTSTTATVSTAGLLPGRHVVTVVAQNTQSWYELSLTQLDEKWTDPQPAQMSVEFVVA
eukprot:TRINITY_DN7349_c0_g1_i1.p1 TRINITY_DN7349_c0_g1~~TRINITY_DN7349_c0_g1_i1.p1  ORF type:complete len:577 (-),score=127.90 TRINITY_DN7349_c0_g1_i1:63-1769(-)